MTITTTIELPAGEVLEEVTSLDERERVQIDVAHRRATGHVAMGISMIALNHTLLFEDASFS